MPEIVSGAQPTDEVIQTVVEGSSGGWQGLGHRILGFSDGHRVYGVGLVLTLGLRGRILRFLGHQWNIFQPDLEVSYAT